MITITAASFANEDRTAVVLTTMERGSVAISQGDRPELWAEYLKWGGATAPFLPPDLNAIDQDALNAALAADGSVLRALAEIVFGIVKGTIPVTPSLTKQQFVTMLKAKMRT